MIIIVTIRNHKLIYDILNEYNFANLKGNEDLNT